MEIKNVNLSKREKKMDFGNLKIRSPSVCASIIGKNLGTMRNDLKEAIKSGADIVELRLDKLENISEWTSLLEFDVPKIVTVRLEKEGGFFEGREKKRIEIFEEAVDRGVECIDISLSTGKKERDQIMKKARKSNTSVILSHHNFEEVPSYKILKKKAEEMEKEGADFAKLIGFAKTPEDSVNILRFLILAEKETEIPIISFAMGEKGKFTRIAAPILGSPITYGSVGEKAAPGQMKIDEVLSIIKKLID